jgi:hydrogenase maturation protein HypF
MQAERVARRRLHIRGVVQGVGFRPHVYALATKLRLTGFVLNDGRGVIVEVEGDPDAIDEFRSALVDDRPPLAIIDGLDEEALAPAGSTSFDIVASDATGHRRAPISADVATCAACLKELFDPKDRRYLYPFTNCTDCGPRFTITLRVPYDRPNTTMRSFDMCDECAAEYHDPSDRRFHAQPIACPRCGPRAALIDKSGKEMPGEPIARAAELIRGGELIAVKGLGGYHIACDASNEHSVKELRGRKGREEKPLAVMVPDLETACRVAITTPHDTAVLASRRRPIVLLPHRAGAGVAESVAPGNNYLGVMLPYTPLHHLLLKEVRRPIVLTSGNLSDEPIAHRDDDARHRLGPIVDAFLLHDRVIHIRCDDSVVRVVQGNEYPLRRARGYAPEPLTVDPPFDRPVLAAGPELKHTFCLGVEGRAILSHHIGDLESWPAMVAFTEAVQHFTRVFDVVPEVVAHDVHPEYLSTKWALGLSDVTTVAVQHHHAHIASCLADNQRTERVIGLALDGTGYGDDGAVWGCEVLSCDLAGYDRLAHLRYVPLPGGAAAIREPWRMAAVYLSEAFGADAERMGLHFVERTRPKWGPILQMAATGLNAPPTSSAGRLFDAAAALCGLRNRVTYEGQAAAELEQLADRHTAWGYPCSLKRGKLDGVELIAALAEDVARGRSVEQAAAAFHNGLASALVKAAQQARDRRGLGSVALSGGTWQNALLLHRVRDALAEAGFEVLVHRRVPPNDGGIALGQAVIANAMRAS